MCLGFAVDELTEFIVQAVTVAKCAFAKLQLYSWVFVIGAPIGTITRNR
jgi:hypothetical protein